ncbi:hypothetical protein HU200_048707 [Digitaria exilis]|uniref:F-box domain-containing protein n=1 Tax=Digitaria exilis TaxID=1010633 RepID=A0A835E776_9POAL|nr:hypothetical protein HU200_048707 [Digitaria exilis]
MPERSSRHAGETKTSTLMAASTNDLPQELLEVVLLHARSSVCLIRAAATCKLWRRVIAAGDRGAFLRRFRRLHPPDVLGHWHYHEGRRRHRPVFFPSPDAPVVDVRGRDSLDFLDHHHYRVSRNMELSDGGCSSSLLAFVKNCSTVVVCDPWTRHHRELTPMCPWKGDSNRGFHSKIIIGVFLLAADDDDAAGGVNMSCFRLLCVSLARKHYGNATAWATMYSARDDRWVSLGSRDVGNIMPDGSYSFNACSKFLGRAGGSLCWSGHVSNGVLHLDESSGVFSTFTLPPDVHHDHQSSYHRGNLRVVGGGSGGSVRLARILDDDLEVLRWSRDGGRKCMNANYTCAAAAGAERTTAMPERSRRAGETSTPIINDLPQDLLELVVLHARSSVCLIHAAATCKHWRRVIAGGGDVRDRDSLDFVDHSSFFSGMLELSDGGCGSLLAFVKGCCTVVVYEATQGAHSTVSMERHQHAWRPRLQ